MKHITLLKIKKKNLMVVKEKLSPNYSKRKKKIKYIILHYTGMENINDTINLFLDQKSKVSCHWLISKRGVLYKIVDEKNVAWHAGISYWKGQRNLNENSIGIELENIGHGKNYTNFSKVQIIILEKLLKEIFERYKIRKRNVLAHSDIAPNRKMDPGELFDWSSLAKKKLAFFPKASKVNGNNFLFQIGQKNKEIYKIKKLLNKIGYYCSNTQTYDLKLKLVIEAFQRRFIPEKVNGIIDNKVYNRIIEVFKNT